MIYYINEIIYAFNKAYPRGRGIKTIATAEDLYKVDDDCEKLSPDKAEILRNLVVKTLYTTNQARPDTCTSEFLLTKIVREPKKNDCRKLVHLMKYIRGMRDLPLILSANVSGFPKWWIDASYAVHPNMRGHKGVGISIGIGFPIVTSTKKKLKPGIFGVHDCIPAVC